MSPVLLLFIFMHVCLSVVSMANTALPNFSSILVFGDSLVDTGNNMYTESIPLGNHLPYGRDFPTHMPTGRISNGKLVPDFLASILKLKDNLPPYLHPNLTDQELLTGVSFASAGAGLEDVTGLIANVIPMSQQIEHFKDYKARIKYIAGEDETTQILANALVVIVIGSNDFMINFYDLPFRSLMFTMDEYQDRLLSILQKSIQDLYDLGCRKFGIGGLTPIGCAPFQIKSKFQINGQCVEDENTFSEQYNKKLKLLLPQMEIMLPGSRMVYVDIFHKTLDLINHPQIYGMEVTNEGCCGLLKVEVGPLCNEFSPVCNDASKYVFWDSFHLTEAGYFHLAKYAEKEILPQFN